MKIFSSIFYFLFFIFYVPTQAQAQAQKNSLSSILNAINLLETKSEPKCYATASRLEDFMFGTPLSAQARFAKNILQKEFIESIWQKASLLATNENEDVILKSHIIHATQQLFLAKKSNIGHWHLTFKADTNINLNKEDKRQYASIAYSLRAVLAVQQEALLFFDLALLPLTTNAIDTLAHSLDLYTLAALKLADNKAKTQNKNSISVENINEVWQFLKGKSATKSSLKSDKSNYQPIKSILLAKTAEKKLSAYAAYNHVSNQIFLRNLQVYMARVRWPKNKQQSEGVIDTFTQLMEKFTFLFYQGIQEKAIEKQLNIVSEEIVHLFALNFIPHQINEYEDALFFPNLSKKEQIYIESYDMDAFRDAGVHWRYLANVVLSPTFTLYVEPDPFAAELIVENIAQYGVLLLRVAGDYAISKGDEVLSVQHLYYAKQHIIDKVKKHHTQIVTEKSVMSAPIISSPFHEVKTDKYGATSAAFVNVTLSSNVQFEHRSSDWLNRQLRSFIKKGDNIGIITIPPAFGGSGVAVEDINNDGSFDILLLGGRGNKLFINDGNGAFIDKTNAFGLDWVSKQDNHPGEVRQPIIADFDNDGWQDIIITYVDAPHRVYKNVSGNRFIDMTDTANLGGRGLVGGPATAFDYDNDGDLDLYITYFGNYIQGDLPTLKRRNANGLPNQLFENKGAFTFENVTKGSGLANKGWAQAVAHTDLNNDQWQDVIVGNDFGVNGYFINQKNGTFKEVSDDLATDKPSYTMGIGISDLNGDLTPDLYISNIVTMNKDETYILPNEDTKQKFNIEKLANMRVIEANDLFISSTTPSLNYVLSDNVGRGYSSTGWSWDADFFDYDLDGDDDLYVLNGMNEFNLYSSRNPYYKDPNDNEVKKALMPVSAKERNIFFENHSGKLNNNSEISGLNILSNSRSASYFDLENDGDLDIVINNFHEAAVVFKNQTINQSVNSGDSHSGNHWLKVKLIGSPIENVNKDAIGTKLVFTLPNGKTIWREVRSTDGYMSVHPKEQHIGLGVYSTVSLKITWPNGKINKVNNIKANQRITFDMDKI